MSITRILTQKIVEVLLVLGVLKTSINLSLLTSKNGITNFFNDLHVANFIYVCSSQLASSQRFCILPMEHVFFFESLPSRKASLQYLFSSSIFWSGLAIIRCFAFIAPKISPLKLRVLVFFFSASVFYSQMHLLCLTQTLHIGSKRESMHSLKNQYIPVDSFCVCDNAIFFLMRLSFIIAS